MNFTPTEDRVLIQRTEEKTETEGGILIPDSAVEKPQEGTIVSVSASSNFAAGQKVLFSKYAGTEIELDEVSFLIINEYDVLGVLTDG
jgi:chaperonin GroES